MNAIRDKGQRATLLVLAALSLLLVGAGAVFAQIPLKSIAQLYVDDDGRALSYPSTVFYDGVEEEIYLVNGGTGRVVVYGPDFFPGVSIGASRGVEAPRGGVVQENGDVYLLQARNVKSARPRITILNGAFFVKREIFLDEIPEAASFHPQELAVSRDGLIYLAGTSSRGVLVLDNEGRFLRRLRPLDIVRNPGNEEETAAEPEPPPAIEILVESDEVRDVAEPEVDIPEEYRPRRGQQGEDTGAGDGLHPVRIGHVTIDSNGRIYLLSGETSKVYVYGPDESFLFSFGRKGGTPRHLSQPRALAIDERLGIIYVADYMRHSILAYSMNGEYQFEFGGRGVGPGWFNFPQDLTINKQGQLIIADLFNRRVQVLEVDYDNSFMKSLLWGDPKQQFKLRKSRPSISESEDAPLADEEAGENDDSKSPPVEQPDGGLGEALRGDALIEETLIDEAVILEAESSEFVGQDSQ